MLSVILSLQNLVCINYLVHSVTQSCPTLCGPMDCSLPGFSVCEIFQARILKWLLLPTPGHLSNPGIKSKPLASPALAGRFFITCATWEAPFYTGPHFTCQRPSCTCDQLLPYWTMQVPNEVIGGNRTSEWEQCPILYLWEFPPLEKNIFNISWPPWDEIGLYL